MFKSVKTYFMNHSTKKHQERDANWYLKRTIIFSYISITISLITISIKILKKLL